MLALETPGTDRRPRSLPELAGERRPRARRGGPVFVSNGAELEEIFSSNRRNGVGAARRALDDERRRSLHAEGRLPGAKWRPDFPGAGLD